MGSALSGNSSFNPATDIPNLAEKVALVTGANTGIGYETAKLLLHHGAKVYLGARNESKALAAMARLKEGTGDVQGQVEWLKLDLSTPSTTRAGAEDFIRRETRLDILC